MAFRLPSMKKAYMSLSKRLSGYSRQVTDVYDYISERSARDVLSVGYSGGEPFAFSDYPELKTKLQGLQEDFVRKTRMVILSNMAKEWGNSNDLQNTIAKRAGKYYEAKADTQNVNEQALRAFQNRREKGLNLSDKIWQQSNDAMRELECALSVAIEKGMDAITLSKRVSQYLQDFPQLQKTYTEMFGFAANIKDCEYRSIRLARSEINMAYRMAERERWQDMDFILGFEVKTSGSHPQPADMCDELAGEYPKDFVFLGWHPNCMCYVVPKVMDDEDYWEFDEQRQDDPDLEPEGRVMDVPDGFKAWKIRNEERIEEATKNGTLPYFVRDNDGVIKGITLEGSLKELMERAKAVGEDVQNIAMNIAERYGASVTPINFKSYESALRKARDMQRYKETPYDMKDLVRTTIVADKQKIAPILEDLQKEPTFNRIKKQLAQDYGGYSGNIVNLKMPNGVFAEIQVNTPYMIYAKESEKTAIRTIGRRRYEQIKRETGMQGGLGHKYYEQLRVMADKVDSPEYEKIAKKMKEYYDHFNR